MSKFDAFVYEGKRYDRDGFRDLLQQRIQEIRSDPKSAYRDSKHPAHAEAVADVNFAYRWLNGEMGEAEENQLAISINQSMGGEQTEVANETRPELEGLREMNAIMAMPEGKTALQRARTGQSLTPFQQSLVNDYKRAEAAHNATVKPTYTGGTFKITRPSVVPSELFEINRISDKRERTFALRELQGKMRDDKNSAYNNVNDPNHKTPLIRCAELMRSWKDWARWRARSRDGLTYAASPQNRL